jgi:hypothetical protein
MLFLALVLFGGLEVPEVTPVVSAAATKLGDVARGRARGKPDRILVVGQCGDRWNGWSLTWAEPGETAPRFDDMDSGVPNDTMIDAVASLCGAFDVKLAEDQAFEFIWSERNGIARFEVGAFVGNYGSGLDEHSNVVTNGFFAS